MRADAGGHLFHRPSFGALLPLLAAAALAAGLVPRFGGRPPGAPSRPDLVFDRDALAIGRFEAGETRDVRVGWRRSGPGVLEVLGVLPRCGCALAEPLPPRLEAGTAGVLRLRLLGLSRPGPFRVHLDVLAGPEGGEVARTRLALEGYVDVPAALRPDRIDLGRVSPGRVVERHVRLACSEALATHSVDAAIEGVDGEVEVAALLRGATPGPTLVVRVRTPGRPGPFEGRLVARVDGWGPLVAAISGEVVVPTR